MTSPILTRYRALPRAARWAVWGLLLVCGYFLLIEPAFRLSEKASTRQARLEQLNRRAVALKQARQTVDTGITNNGLVALPGDPESRSVAFNSKIAEILKKHGVREDSTTRTALLPANSPLGKAIGNDHRVEKLIKDLSFDAEPEQVIAVLADLERAPEIAAVSRVQVRKPPESERTGRTVRATLSVEAWTLRANRARNSR